MAYHRKSSTRLYKVWAAIKDRCYNTRSKHYRYYGARGITMHGPWRDSFVTFAAEIGARPTRQHTIDRVDNNGPYAPGNCRWATAREQAANRRSHRWLTLDGETRTVSEWSRHLGISNKRIDARLRRGASDVEALSIEKRVGRPPVRLLVYQGEARSADEWSALLGINRGTISARLTRGWTVERTLSEPARAHKAR